MDAKGKERGILKLDCRPRAAVETRSELTPQGSCDRVPSSPQPSVDRLSVTWADPGSMTSSGVNLFHLPTETPINNEVKFSPSAGDGSEDEDYSASLSAVLRQRRASVRRSRKGRTRRPSSPFLTDENRQRRRSSVFTTSSGDTAISIDEGQPAVVTQEQIFENIHLHKEVLGSVKQQPLGMRRKLKIVHQAKAYIKRHEGQLQERLAQSKSTRDIYARFNILMATRWHQMKREAANMSNLLIPWELRIKEIESHFGSVVASYFTFLRWLFWVNLVIGFILLVFVIVPEYLMANPSEDGERKTIMEDERGNATNLLILWEFEGILKYSPIFYGYYSNVERDQYRMPLAYFLTGLVVYIYSFVAILRKMAENSRMSKLSEKEDECIFSWKLFTGWDFMIGNTETAHNRIASVILGFKEALLEEAEKKKDLRNWRIISLRALVNVCVIVLLAVSAYAVVTVVSRSDDNTKYGGWWRENETTIVVTVITTTFPVFFEMLGFLEHYHPRKQLRLQLARIMLLNLLNLYSLIFALFSKIEGMSKELYSLKPVDPLHMNLTNLPNHTIINEMNDYNSECIEERIMCLPCGLMSTITTIRNSEDNKDTTTPFYLLPYKPTSATETLKTAIKNEMSKQSLPAENLLEKELDNETLESTTLNSISIISKELEKLRSISKNIGSTETNDYTSDTEDEDYTFDNFDYDTSSTIDSRTYSTSVEDYDYKIDTFSTVTSLDQSSADGGHETDMSENSETDKMSSMVVDYSWTTLNIDITTFTSPTEISDESTNYSLESTYNEFTTELPNGSEGYNNSKESNTTSDYTTSTETYTNDVSVPMTSTDVSTDISTEINTICPNISFNCSVTCGGQNITQVFFVSNCTVIEKRCYVRNCTRETVYENENNAIQNNQTNVTLRDVVYIDKYNRKKYNLTIATRKKLLKLCWETMFGQELVKLTMMDLVFVLLGTLFMDFFRALFVRYMNRCWCWDLEKKFPEYGDFKIAENILHLINNQGMVWMGMFFSPGLVVLNVFKLVIMMYLRSWAVMTCNVPHEVVFRVSKSNNFYLALLLTMLFLCVLPVGYTIVWVKPSWHCGPFSEHGKIYHILTNYIYSKLPDTLNFALEYIASPAIVIPLLVLLILIIYYLTSLTNSLREANNDLKIQLRRERTEERRKMFQLADNRRRVGSTAMDNTPFARWKKALPSLPLSKSIDSDDKKVVTGDEGKELHKTTKKKGSIFAKIVGMALDKKTDKDGASENLNFTSPSPNNDDETDTDFHEGLPKEVLKIKDITVAKVIEPKKRTVVEFKADTDSSLKVAVENEDDRTEKKAIMEKRKHDVREHITAKPNVEVIKGFKDKLSKKQTSESSTQSKQSDSIGSVIPVITISTTESDDELLQKKKKEKKTNKNDKAMKIDGNGKPKKCTSDWKSLRRQSSVDSISEQNPHAEKKNEDGHKYQYSL